MYVSWSWWSLFNALLVPYISGWLSKNEILNFKLSNHIQPLYQTRLVDLVLNQFIFQYAMFERFIASRDSRCCRQLRSTVFNSSSLHQLMPLTWWILPGLPHFCHSSASLYYCQHKPKSKNTKCTAHHSHIRAVLAAAIGVRYRSRLGEEQMGTKPCFLGFKLARFLR